MIAALFLLAGLTLLRWSARLVHNPYNLKQEGSDQLTDDITFLGWILTIAGVTAALILIFA